MEALLLSDVIGDDLDVIGSGPTAPDASTFADAAGILEKYEIFGARAGDRARAHRSRACAARSPRRPSPATRLSPRAQYHGGQQPPGARRARRARARELGFRTLVLSSEIQGETREVARMHAAIAREMVRSAQPVQAARLHHHRRGDHRHAQGRRPGRAQPGVRAGGRHRHRRACPTWWSSAPAPTAPTAPPMPPAPSPTAIRSRRKPDARRFLDANDSYHYFEPLGDLVITGPTNTNVMDVRILLVG